jgi:hypothetical protein
MLLRVLCPRPKIHVNWFVTSVLRGLLYIQNHCKIRCLIRNLSVKVAPFYEHLFGSNFDLKILPKSALTVTGDPKFCFLRDPKITGRRRFAIIPYDMPELSWKGYLFETMRMTRAVNYGGAEFAECRGKVLKAGSKSRGNKSANCALYLTSKRVVDLRLNHVPGCWSAPLEGILSLALLHEDKPRVFSVPFR